MEKKYNDQETFLPLYRPKSNSIAKNDSTEEGSIAIRTRLGNSVTSARDMRLRRLRCSWLMRIAALAVTLLLISFFDTVLMWIAQITTDLKKKDNADRIPTVVMPATPRKLERFEVSKLTISNLETLEVSFVYASPHPDTFVHDRIAAYCVEEKADGSTPELPSVHDSMDSRGTHGQPAGTVHFGPMVNMRCLWLFRFLSEGEDHATIVLAESPLVRFVKGPTEPLQVHLAMTTRPTEMRVKWTSANVSQPMVRYGTNKGKLDQHAMASQASYQAQDMCSSPATHVSPREYRDPGQIYDALMTGLIPETRYYYQVGDQDGKVWSVVFEFEQPPAAGSAGPMSFFVFGDLNSPVSATSNFAVPGSCGTTIRLIEADLNQTSNIHEENDAPEHKYVAVMHVGDVSYAKGSTYVWDQFGQLIEGVASKIPYMVSIGNHDYGYLEGNNIDPAKFPRNPTFEADGTHGHDAYGECGVPTQVRFHMPDNGNDIFWYSVEMGLVHHTVLSGEHDFVKGSPMHTWLLQDLERIDRNVTPWVMLHMHRPMYCSVAYKGDYYRSLLYRDHLEQVLADYHVDVVFSGHYHSYERTCAVFDQDCYYSEDGKVLAPVHLMVGSGGANVDNFGYYDYSWRETGLLTYGYGRMHIYNATHAQFEFVQNDAERVVDSAWIVSDHDWPNDRSRRHRFTITELIILAMTGVLLCIGYVLWKRKRRT